MKKIQIGLIMQWIDRGNKGGQRKLIKTDKAGTLTGDSGSLGTGMTYVLVCDKKEKNEDKLS